MNNESSMSSNDTSSDGDTIESIRIMDGTSIGTIVPRRSTWQNHLAPTFSDYVLMDNVMNVIEPTNYEQVKD